MRVTLNGNQRELPDSISLENVIEQHSIPKDQIVVELNGDIITKKDWPSKIIANGDCVELLKYVGGGS